MILFRSRTLFRGLNFTSTSILSPYSISLNKTMDFRVVRKFFYQKWRGHALKNNTRREIVFLLLGAPRYALEFSNLLRLTFIRVNCVMDDGVIFGLFTDDEMAQFVKFSTTLPSGESLVDLTLSQVISLVDHDWTSIVAYLDLTRVFQNVGVDLTCAGPDPMSAPEAFYLKLLWPGYIESDEKYVAIMIAGILSTRWDLDQGSVTLPPYSMHLTEVGMHLKSLEAVDASLAWALPALKNEGLRLARFLGKSEAERYFSVTDSPCHHSDKVVSLNTRQIWKDAERLWSMHDVSLYLRGGEHLVTRDAVKAVGIEKHLASVTRLCAEAALVDEAENDGRTNIGVGGGYDAQSTCCVGVIPRGKVSQTSGDVYPFMRENPYGLTTRNGAMSTVDVQLQRRPLVNLVQNNSYMDCRRGFNRLVNSEVFRMKNLVHGASGVENEAENTNLLR